MDFKDLSYVLAIARYQNITKAANSLYVTQPTLTKFLQNLESELGQKLFRKLGHRFVLTYAGEHYVESIGDPEPKKRAGPGDERHREEQLRLFKDCLSDHARHLHASLYPADFQFLISQRAPGNPGVAFLFTGRYAAERRG